MKIYCSGIGGIGLSAYAFHMLAQGHTVFGSDKTASDITKELESSGAVLSFSQDGLHVPKDTDLFVYSEAIPVSSPERQKGSELGIPEKSYFEALGDLARGKVTIAVCGTHGKSSTTAMLAKILVDAGRDPSVVVGTKVPDLGGKNWRKGSDDLWIIEACEYRRSFLHLHPTMILATNVDGDHFDAFQGKEDYQQAFIEFFSRMPNDGTVIHHARDEEMTQCIERSKRKGLNADLLDLPELSIPGEHMRQNAALALSASVLLGIPESKARESLRKFAGTWRRMEIKGKTKKGSIVIDDYAHHPVEIQATLAGIRQKYPEKKIVCVFQPHTHDRTLKLWKEFERAFADANEVIVLPVYDARPDRERESADVTKLASGIAARSKISVTTGQSLQSTKQKLVAEYDSENVLITMGAGDITNLSTMLISSQL